MNCPHCDFKFRVLAINGNQMPEMAPLVCESCSEVSLYESGTVRKLTPVELDYVKRSPAYCDVIAPAIEVIRRAKKAQNAITNRFRPLAPKPESDEDRTRRDRVVAKILNDAAKISAERQEQIEAPPVDRSAQTLTDGSPVTPDHKEIDPATGMQKGYVVLSAEERAKGFVRPVRNAYKHVGAPGPKYPLLDLTDVQKRQHLADQFGYVKYEKYQDSESPKTGRFWTQAQLDRIGKGCRTVTTMGTALAETYARDFSFYSGTFCADCRAHFPVGEDGEFVWAGTNERVGT